MCVCGEGGEGRGKEEERKRHKFEFVTYDYVKGNHSGVCVWMPFVINFDLNVNFMFSTLFKNFLFPFPPPLPNSPIVCTLDMHNTIS